MPRKQIIAESYAAMEPGIVLWRKYMDEISHLKERGDICEDDYYILRALPQARYELADMTMGNEEAFVEGSSLEILKRVRQTIRADDLQKLETERRLRQDAESRLRDELIKSATKEERITSKISRFAAVSAFSISRFLQGAIIIILAVGAYFTFPQTSVNVEPGIIRYIFFAFAVVLVLFSIYNIVWGATVQDKVKHLETFIHKQIEKRLMKWLLS